MQSLGGSFYFTILSKLQKIFSFDLLFGCPRSGLGLVNGGRSKRRAITKRSKHTAAWYPEYITRLEVTAYSLSYLITLDMNVDF